MRCLGPRAATWRVLGSIALAFALCGRGSSAAWASTGAICPVGHYAYAGVIGQPQVSGVASTVTALIPPSVVDGHVAGWVGVGGVGQGPQHTNEWLQAGLSSFGDDRTRLYYEFVLPGEAPRYVDLGEIPPGEPHRVAVLEMAAHPASWRVWLDGRPATAPITLPGSHDALLPVATAESWSGGDEPGACNSFSYRFQDVRVARAAGGSWRPFPVRWTLHDSVYQLDRDSGGFVAGWIAPPTTNHVLG